MSSKLPILVAHGGCLAIKSNRTNVPDPQKVAEAKQFLRRSLVEGYKVLRESGNCLDAVIETVRLLEDAPCFNAGKGSVFTRDFTIEMDAGLMDGHSGNAAGVGAVSRIKNPIILANEVMSKTPHALLCCSGAEKFAKNCSTNVVFETPEYFQTQIRRQQLENLLKENNCNTEKSDSLGTVGAVAIDENSRLATASSTGGLSGKLSGRVGDSCIVGAGFYADKNVAVTGTGNGDVFVKKQTCVRVAQLLATNESLTLDQACRQILDEYMQECGAGLIAVDSRGQISMVFNTSDMYRGYAMGENEVEVFFEK